MAQTYFTPDPKRAKVNSTTDRGFEIVENGCVLSIHKREKELDKVKRVVVAAFDLDGTLVVTESGYTFARHGNDWKLLPRVEEVITRKIEEIESKNEGVQVVCVLFTNQGSAIPSPEAKSFSIVQTKLEGVAKRLPFIDYVYASLQIKNPEQKQRFRKPGSGMFDVLKRDLKDREIHFGLSFFVGDAAGRAQDHSSDDKGFAENAELKFYTPDEFFNWTKEESEQSVPPLGRGRSHRNKQPKKETPPEKNHRRD